MVETMTPEHHDRVLAITSHLPHLIAYTIVGTVADLEDHLQTEVLRYAAGGFTDFTRIAASDPVMWRDVFLHNREAVLEMLGRFTEDLAALQRAIRWGEGDKLQDLFTRTRAIRRGVIAEGQAYDRQALTEAQRQGEGDDADQRRAPQLLRDPGGGRDAARCRDAQCRAQAGDPRARAPGPGRPAQQPRRLAVELGFRDLGRPAGQAPARRRARARDRRPPIAPARPVRVAWTTNAWANVNRRGHGNEFHTHPGAYWSGTYYVDDGGIGEDHALGGEFEMQDPARRRAGDVRAAARLRRARRPVRRRERADLPEERPARPVPVLVQHGVRPYRGDRERISVAFNSFGSALSARWAGAERVWIFAYGSLMWRPGFAHDEVLGASARLSPQPVRLLHGCTAARRSSRAWCSGLDRGGSCRGWAFAVAAEREAEVLPISTRASW